MRISVLLIMVMVMSAVQIGLWISIPKSIRHFMFANPILAFIANLLGSMLIVGFTGIASMVGTANLAASLIFVLYVKWYNKKHSINCLKVKWVRILWIIPIFPIIGVNYKRR